MDLTLFQRLDILFYTYSPLRARYLTDRLMPKDRLQQQRFELKYIIPAPLALAARDFVRSYLEVDEFGASQPDLSYPVHSLYLDSEKFDLHQSTINGDKNRFKLRLRFYENRPNAPVFVEIKKRMDNTISKERGAVKREAVDALLAGHLPDAGQMASDDPGHLLAVQHFCEHLNRLQAKPRVHVAYAREAWLPPQGDNSVRVTFDRRVRSCPEPNATLSPEMTDPVFVFGNAVVLELKFTERFPNWCRELVRVFGLRQTSAAKYVDGVLLMEERNVLHEAFRAVGVELPPLQEAPGGPARQRKVRHPSAGFNKYIPDAI